MQHEQTSKYAIPLADLEGSARVPREEQVSERAEPPAEGPISTDELDRRLLLGITGAGRLRRDGGSP